MSERPPLMKYRRGRHWKGDFVLSWGVEGGEGGSPGERGRPYFEKVARCLSAGVGCYSLSTESDKERDVVSYSA